VGLVEEENEPRLLGVTDFREGFKLGNEALLKLLELK